MTAARSVSPFAADLLDGPLRQGVAIGHGYIRFGQDVLAVTPPGRQRMPNGIEADVKLLRGQSATVGEGALRAGDAVVTTGRRWDPRPETRYAIWLVPQPEVQLRRLAGRGPGLTPLGDDILIGYIARRALTGLDSTALAAEASASTTALSSTLLRLAALGQLPEAAHPLLESGDLLPLLHFGATSGRGIALGLALAGEPGEKATAFRAFGSGHFEFEIGRRIDRPLAAGVPH